MKPRSLALLVLAGGSFLAIGLVAAHAQSPSSRRPASFNRVQTQSQSRSQSQPGAVATPGYELNPRARGLARTGANDALTDAASSMRPYTDDDSGRITRTAAGTGAGLRPYERAPVMTPPARSDPAPHNYYPSLRQGQGPNRNLGARAHCVPGRGAFLNR